MLFIFLDGILKDLSDYFLVQNALNITACYFSKEIVVCLNNYITRKVYVVLIKYSLILSKYFLLILQN